MNSKIILDGFGVKLKAIRGVPDNSCPRRGKDTGYREITIETENGEIYIFGCSACHVLSVSKTGSDFTTNSEEVKDE